MLNDLKIGDKIEWEIGGWHDICYVGKIFKNHIRTYKNTGEKPTGNLKKYHILRVIKEK